MTLREKICATEANTLRELLCLPCEGGGDCPDCPESGTPYYVPLSDIECDLVLLSLDCTLTTQIVDADLEIVMINAILSTTELSADLVIETLEAELCQ